jgi:anti-sigma-K factor RskA
MSSEMIINRDNYELYFLDHLEGRLDEKLRLQLRQFMEENPDLAAELKGMEKIRLNPDQDIPPIKKEILKKKVVPVNSINENNIDEKLIASVEGDLAEDESRSLKKFLQLNPSYQYDQKLFQATVSEPDTRIIFQAKEQLKHRKLVLMMNRWYIAASAAAAIILLLLGWRFLYFDKSQPDIYENDIVRITHEEVINNNISRLERKEATEIVHVIETNLLNPDITPLILIAKDPPVTMGIMAAGEVLSEATNPSPEFRAISAELLASTAPSSAESSSPRLLGKILHNYSKKVRERQEMVRANPSKQERNISFWDIADLGIKGYNTIADREVELEVIRDKTGAAVEYSFSENDRVLLSRDLNPQ